MKTVYIQARDMGKLHFDDIIEALVDFRRVYGSPAQVIVLDAHLEPEVVRWKDGTGQYVAEHRPPDGYMMFGVPLIFMELEYPGMASGAIVLPSELFGESEMKITQVTVSIHEKRNHPYEFGHYDCSVTYSADLAGQDNVDEVTLALRGKARGHVEIECDRWLDTIHEKRRIGDIECRLHPMLESVANNYHKLSYAKRCVRQIRKLPQQLQEPWRGRLREALAGISQEAKKFTF